MRPQEVVERKHVLFFGELHMIGDVLEYLGHQHKAALNGRRHLTSHYAHFLRRYCNIQVFL